MRAMDSDASKATTLQASSGLPATSRQISSPSCSAATMIAQASRASVGISGSGSAGAAWRRGGGGLLRLREDHPPSDGLQDARHRDVNRVAHVGLAILNDDHRAVVQIANALS